MNESGSCDDEYDFISCSSSPLQMGTKLLRYSTTLGYTKGSLVTGGNIINLQPCQMPTNENDEDDEGDASEPIPVYVNNDWSEMGGADYPLLEEKENRENEVIQIRDEGWQSLARNSKQSSFSLAGSQY